MSKQKKQKKAVIVIGPECSGTRLLTRMCLAAGCYGDANAEPRFEYNWNPQRWDAEDPDCEPIVLRRTMPYHPARTMPDLHVLAKRLDKLGYKISVIMTKRNHAIIGQSQASKRYVGSVNEGTETAINAYAIIDAWLKRYKLPAIICEYETLVKQPAKTINRILKAAGLKTLRSLPEKIYDGNEKYRKAEK